MTEGTSMAVRAPAVVAVVVTRDPGPWFDEVLEGLAAQRYEDLSVLVLAAGAGDASARVAAHLPDAFVRRLTEDHGFGAGVNQALAMVEGAAFFLLVHDDCALDPGAVHALVEESFRSNAGVVSPKMVHWDDPRVLLHVGQNVDKSGAVVERVQPGEIDAGQHDAVRDVFVAPGGCMLVRADLLRALGGFDETITAMGEDLDLSWRAHVAGARVVVAPEARVRHREVLAGGGRVPARAPGSRRAPSLQALQRRHELAVVLTCYSWLQLLRVLPQALLLAAGEIVVAGLVGDRRRVRAVAGAWRWNLAHRRWLRSRRAALARVRAVPDGEVRSLQVRGSARLSTYLARLTHQGVTVAHGLARGRGGPEDERDGTTSGDSAASTGAGTWSAQGRAVTAHVGTAFSEDADFDELDDLGRRVGDGPGRTPGRRALGTVQGRLAAWLVVALLLVVGSRGLFGAALPLVGQYAPFPSWTGAWHQLLAGWQPAGLGSAAPSSPGYGVLGILGTFLIGHMGLLQQVAVLGCIPLGAWGMSRLLGPFGSPRARFAGVAAYLAVPLPYDALARGRWDGLVAYALTPWVMGQLARATGLPPFAAADRAAPRKVAGAWAPRVLRLGALEALAVALVPAMALVVLLCGLGIAGGSALAGGWRAGRRAAVVALAATVTAAVLCLPWLVATVAAGRAGVSVLGLAGSPGSAPGWGALVRLAVGPVGASPLSWLLPAAALAPLLVGREHRLAWAARWWAAGAAGWLLALVAAKAWAAPFAPSLVVMLAPAAVAVGGGAGLAVAAFDADLAGYRFGWRQTTALVSLAALAVGVVPAVAEVGDGRWGLPSSGFAAAVSLPAASGQGGYRVLWLGDPGALPAAGWPIGPGLAYATSTDGLPAGDALWAPAAGARPLAHVVTLALRGATVDAGRLLARDKVRYVVVVGALAPQIPGVQQPAAVPPPTGLVAALGRQVDLRALPTGAGGVTVFANAAMGASAGGTVTSPPPGGSRTLDTVAAAVELVLWALLAALFLRAGRVLAWTPLGWRRRARARHRAVVARVTAPPPADPAPPDPPPADPAPPDPPPADPAPADPAAAEALAAQPAVAAAAEAPSRPPLAVGPGSEGPVGSPW